VSYADSLAVDRYSPPRSLWRIRLLLAGGRVLGIRRWYYIGFRECQISSLEWVQGLELRAVANDGGDSVLPVT
jgi:hypothetical protein